MSRFKELLKPSATNVVGRRRRLLFGAALLTLLVVGGLAAFFAVGGGSATDPNSAPTAPGASAGAAPPQAADAVTAVLSGDVARMREAVAPPLDEHLLAPAATGSTAPGSGDVRLSGWRQQEAFAGATAEVARPGGPSRLLVGFMLVDGKWRITFVEPLP